MKKGLRKFLAVGISLFGTLLAIYVGGYRLLFRPVCLLINEFSAGSLTRQDLIGCIIKIFLASTIAGAIWCIFDIIAGKFRDE